MCDFVPDLRCRKRFLFIFILLCPFFSSGLYANSGPQRPNIVILLADDLGWNDVGYHGSRIRTPHIDQLAREGVELDRFYVAPWCSPTRAGLMTGRYAHRYGYQYVPKAMSPSFLPAEAQTLAEMLETAGYKRRSYIGKWHLQNGDKGGHPLDQGFTDFYGMLGGGVDYFTHRTIPGTRNGKSDLDWFRNREPSNEKGYTTDLIGAEAVRIISSSARDQPFFLYVAFNAPHVPLQAMGEAFSAAPAVTNWGDIENYSKGRDVEIYRQIFGAMVGSLDSNIGKILAAIDESDLRSNTLVLFLSDNGGDITYAPSDNSPLRGGKATVWEGGVRVPAIMRWPAFFPGGTRISEPLSYVDLFPTLAEIAGLPSPFAPDLDGDSVLGVLAGNHREFDRRIYLGAGAMVDGNWKLVEDKLFAIKTDPGETTDVAASHQDIVEKFRAEVKQIDAH